MHKARLPIPTVSQTGERGLTVERFLVLVAAGSKATPQWIASIRVAPPAAPHNHCNNDADSPSFKDGVYKPHEGGRLLALSRPRDSEAFRTIVPQAVVSVDPIFARI